MTQKIQLVSGNTKPTLVMSLTDQTTGNPIDVSNATQILMRMRALGDTTVITIPCQKLMGMVNPDGSINAAAPYNVLGAGGRISMDWTPASLANAGEFEGEVQITFGDGTIQTVYKTLRFSVRSQF